MMGVFIARTLSWVGAEFDTVTVSLTLPEETVYNAAAEWWMNLQVNLKKATAALKGNVPKTMMRGYWSASQRFWKELAVTFKVNYVVESALKDVEDGKSVVIGLQVSARCD